MAVCAFEQDQTLLPSAMQGHQWRYRAKQVLAKFPDEWSFTNSAGLATHSSSR